jgi:hypothetical protein
MFRISKIFSAITTFVLAIAFSITPANALMPPTIISPVGLSVVNADLALRYTIPTSPTSSSVTVTLTRTTPSSPAFTRTLNMSNARNVDISFNAFASDFEIIARGDQKVIAVGGTAGAMPIGIYNVTVSYQDGANGVFSASSQGVTFTIPCAVGTYSSDGNVPVGSDCTQSPANSYVATAGATAATACPIGLISPAGSDAVSDCVSPAVATPLTKALPTLAKGKKMKIKTLATQIEMSIPAKSKVSAKVAKNSKKFCKVSGTSIKALKTGSCVVTVKVKPKKGATTTKATTITIN